MFQKIINDTLKTPDGKWSRKSLIMLASFIMSMITGIYIVISDKISNIAINGYAITVFQGFLLLTATLVGATIIDKQTLFKNAKP